MSNVELKLKDTINDNDIYDIYIDNVYAGGLEANYDPRINSFYIENIKKSDSYKEGHLLEDVVNYLYNDKGYDLGCLPLEKYRGYYEELGFTPFIYNDNDVYYHKIHKGDNMKTDEFLNEVKKIINEDDIFSLVKPILDNQEENQGPSKIQQIEKELKSTLEQKGYTFLDERNYFSVFKDEELVGGFFIDDYERWCFGERYDESSQKNEDKTIKPLSEAMGSAEYDYAIEQGLDCTKELFKNFKVLAEPFIDGPKPDVNMDMLLDFIKSFEEFLEYLKNNNVLEHIDSQEDLDEYFLNILNIIHK